MHKVSLFQTAYSSIRPSENVFAVNSDNSCHQ
ncbi:hypothetical protein TW90_0273 [Neisseria flavescens]|nr:hypothetical protein TW90_0273 [Neisseria flavescens]